MIKIDEQKINEILTRGVEEVFKKESLQKKLRSGKQLRIKHGIDPTGPKIHIGRAFQFWKLRDFQDMGHKVVLIIGDFTAHIGDASDKQSMRKVLTQKEIKENMKDYAKQVGRILDMRKVELRYNSEWFKKMRVIDFVDIQMNFTAQQLIQRRNFKERWEEGKPIGAHELDYPLFQGYDSVAVKADVETGGSDQLFNLQAGREVQKYFGQQQQDIMTMKMLNGLDGRKMSTSWGNIITILDEADEMYGKVMSMSDNLISEYFELATRLRMQEIEEIEAMPNPRDQKARLAKEIVKMYHGEKDAQRAEREFNKIFRDKELPSEMPVFVFSLPKDIVFILVNTNIASSKNEAWRLVDQGAVKFNNNIIKNPKEMVVDEGVVQVGPRRFVKIVKI